MRNPAMWTALREWAGAVLLLLPARRRCRELEAENAELRSLRDHVETSAGYLASCVERSRTYS